MPNQMLPKILTEKELQDAEETMEFAKLSFSFGADVDITPEFTDSILNIIASHRELYKANAELTFKNMKLKEKDAKVAEFMDWAKRIIDSGMGAGILRYDPVQFFIQYHTYLKSLEESK